MEDSRNRTVSVPVPVPVLPSSAATILARRAMHPTLEVLLGNIPADTNDDDDDDNNNENNNKTKFLTICTNSIPENMDFMDGCVVVCILVLIGSLDLQEQDAHITFHYDVVFSSYTVRNLLPLGSLTIIVDDNCRIRSLTIYEIRTATYDLPAIIKYLGKLEVLYLQKCRSLPSELSELESLEHLFMEDCPLCNLFDGNSVPVDMELKKLKTLSVTDCVFIPKTFLAWVAEKLPSINDLSFVDIEDIDSVLDFLYTTSPPFRNKLGVLRLVRCRLEENQAGAIIQNILPTFPNLKSLSLCYNKIKSVRAIVERIKNDSTGVRSKSLHTLNLEENDIMKIIKKQPKEKAALLDLLRILPTIYRIGWMSEAKYYDSDVQSLLRINHAGRYLLEGHTNNNSTNAGNSTGEQIRVSGYQQSLLPPLSLWPIILNRAYEKSKDVFYGEKDATGLNYLIRNGPEALIGSRRGPTVRNDGDSGHSIKIDIAQTNRHTSSLTMLPPSPSSLKRTLAEAPVAVAVTTTAMTGQSRAKDDPLKKGKTKQACVTNSK